MMGKLEVDHKLEQDKFEGVDEEEWVSYSTLYFLQGLVLLLIFICDPFIDHIILWDK